MQKAIYNSSPPKMRISLIYPPISVSERYGTDIGDIGGKQAPLGLLYLASFIKKAGHEVQVIDAEAENLINSSICKRIKEFNPDCLGISITTVAYANATNLAKKIKTEFRGIPIIAGGPHITANHKEFLKEKAFDVGVFGEGELTLCEILDSFCRASKLANIKGIVFRENGGDIIVNEPREYIEHLDNIPYPDRNMLPDIKLYRPPLGCYRESFVVSLITSRGCPYKCIFCDNNTFGRKTRHFSPEYVVNEIKMVLNKYDAKELTFVDDTFPCNKTRFRQILNLILKRKLNFIWTCMANLNDLSEELVLLMRKAGCWQIAVGIESGDDEILKLIKKGLTTKKIRQKVQLAHKAGIQVKGFFMIGHPGETSESIKKTIELALELPLTDATCTIATPIKGTEFYELAMSGEYGKFFSRADSSRFSYWEPVFIPKDLAANQLYKAQRVFFKRFYLRPKIFFRQLKKIKNITVLWRCLKTIYKLIKSKPKMGN